LGGCTDVPTAGWVFEGWPVGMYGPAVGRFRELTRGDVSTIDGGTRMTGGDVSVSCWREPPSLTVTYRLMFLFCVCFFFLTPFFGGFWGSSILFIYKLFQLKKIPKAGIF